MASTNQTTHYDLSQYIATDKPTYLVDYNGDMNKIDTAIYGADSRSLTNQTSIGDLTTLTTTAKTNLVSAINEVDGEASKIGNLSNLTTTAHTDLVSAINEVDSEADTNTSAIGTLANLDTTVKTNLVGATNEVNSKVATVASDLNTFEQVFNLVNFKEYNNSPNTMDYVDASFSSGRVKTAFNSDYSLGKVYGHIEVNASGYLPKIILKDVIPSGYRPSSDITINGLMTIINNSNNSYATQGDVIFKTNGDVNIEFASGVGSGIVGLTLHPCVLFMKDFGDTSN